MSNPFDVIIIGSGPAGYVCAIRCAQLGLSTAVIEQSTGDNSQPLLGGTCLNVGCIPSKALLDSSQRYADAAGHLSEHGIGVGEVSLDIAGMMARKEKIVSQLTGGVSGLLKHNGVTVITGAAMLMAGREVAVTDGRVKWRITLLIMWCWQQALSLLRSLQRPLTVSEWLIQRGAVLSTQCPSDWA